MGKDQFNYGRPDMVDGQEFGHKEESHQIESQQPDVFSEANVRDELEKAIVEMNLAEMPESTLKTQKIGNQILETVYEALVDASKGLHDIMSRREFNVRFAAFIIALLHAAGIGVEFAFAQESANVLKYAKAEIPEGFVESLAEDEMANTELSELMAQRLNPYQRTRVRFTPEQVLRLSDLPGFVSQENLQRLIDIANSFGVEYQFDAAVYCNAEQTFFITTPNVVLSESYVGNNGLSLESGTLITIDNDGQEHYIEPNQLVSPSMADVLVVNQALLNSQTATFTYQDRSLNFQSMQEGDVILVERTIDPTNSRLIAVAEYDRMFPLVELRVGTGGNVRSERNLGDSIIRPANSEDIYVTAYQMTLESAQTEFQESNLERDEVGRYFVQDGQYRWYLIELHPPFEGENFGWSRSDAVGEPDVTFATATALPTEVVSNATPTPDAPVNTGERNADSQFPITESNGTYQMRGRLDGVAVSEDENGLLTIGDLVVMAAGVFKYMPLQGPEQKIAVILGAKRPGYTYLSGNGVYENFDLDREGFEFTMTDNGLTAGGIARMPVSDTDLRLTYSNAATMAYNVFGNAINLSYGDGTLADFMAAGDPAQLPDIGSITFNRGTDNEESLKLLISAGVELTSA